MATCPKCHAEVLSENLAAHRCGRRIGDDAMNNCHSRWLREAAEKISDAGHIGWGNTCAQAADEIDALQAHRDNILVEIERLQHDLSRSVEATTQYLNEAERLRAALQWYADEVGTGGRVAREALFPSAGGNT